VQLVGQLINPRATNCYPDTSARFYDDLTENKNVQSPRLARGPCAKRSYAASTISRSTTQDFAGTIDMRRPDVTLVGGPSLSLEEVQAIVDEAHRMGLKVACR
jgi:hypothetical protein